MKDSQIHKIRNFFNIFQLRRKKGTRTIIVQETITVEGRKGVITLVFALIPCRKFETNLFCGGVTRGGVERKILSYSW